MGYVLAAVIVIAVYLVLILPRVSGKPDVSPLMGYFYAHRGLHDNNGDAPENSMAAFRRAIHSGYGIEFDVQLTKDRIPVVFHDPTLKRVCGVDGRVRDFTYEELQKFALCRSQERIPLFADFLKLVDGQVPLIVEIKIHENANTVCQIVDELLCNYEGVYCVESFHPLAVKWYKEHRPEVIRGQLSTHRRTAKGASAAVLTVMQYLLTNVFTRPDFIAYDHRYKGNISRILCGMFGALRVTWTVKSQKELDACRNDFDLFIFEGFLPE